MTILRASNPKRYVPGTYEFFGLIYPTYPDLKAEFCNELTSERSFEEAVSMVGISTAGVKNESQALPSDDVVQNLIQQTRFLTYGKQVFMSMESMEDDLYSPSIEELLGRLFARAMHDYEQRVAHNVLNLGFSAVSGTASGLVYQDPDALSLFNSAHVLTKGGTYSNTLAVGTTLSEASIETVVTNIRNVMSADGNRIAINPVKLIVSPADEFNAKRILESEWQTSSANNDINAVSRLGLKLVVSPYLTAGNWFITTDINDEKDGLIFWRRKEVAFDANQATDGTLNTIFTCHARGAASYNNPQAVFGVEGY